jgi:hypothetical protein
MGVIDLVLRRSNILHLRKKYDRLREKSDRVTSRDRRLALLRMLDQIEPSIIVLEEHFVSHYEKKRMAYRIERNLSDVQNLLADKEFYAPMTRDDTCSK